MDTTKTSSEKGSVTGIPSTCTGTTRYGRPCPNASISGKDVCWHHDPENAERRKRNATAGGKAAHSPAVLEIRELKDEIKDLMREVKEGSIPPNTAAAMTQLANTLLRGIEQERKVRELDEVEETLEQLEAGEEAA